MSISASIASNPLAEDLDHILRHTEGLWESLRGESVFLTGGTGFFGRWLLESFANVNRELSLGATAVVLSRNPERFAQGAPHLGGDAGIHFVRGDVQDFTAAQLDPQLPQAVPRQHAFVIHAATEASAQLNADAPLRMIDTIVQGTRNTLEFAVATGCRRFLLTSSGAVYGRQPSELTHVPEDYVGAPDCTDPGSAYGEGKRLAELLCACYQKKHGLEPLIARCFAFVGPFLPLETHFAIGNFIRDALRGGPIQVSGDGTPCRSYLYAADLAIWLWTILLKGTPLRPYNVGSDDDLSIEALAGKVSAIQGAVDVQIGVARDPAKRPTRYVPRCTRAREELQLEHWVGLSEAIQKTLSFAEGPPARMVATS